MESFGDGCDGRWIGSIGRPAWEIRGSPFCMLCWCGGGFSAGELRIMSTAWAGFPAR